MPSFLELWNAHPGRADVCDKATFGNQCAMRMGAALRTVGANLSGLKTCVQYDSNTFASHAPGHVRAAQDLANHFYRKTSEKGLGASSFKVYTGSITANIASLKDAKGMIFIMNGWGSTDHIDVWQGNGSTGTLKGGDSSYFAVGEQIWFWAFA
jgi:Type VI secretion system (T6SS), amidase effector protein 4